MNVIGIKRRYTCICLFGDNSLAAKDPVPPCALVCMTLFGNVYVHVQKRAGDQYQCNERTKIMVISSVQQLNYS